MVGSASGQTISIAAGADLLLLIHLFRRLRWGLAGVIGLSFVLQLSGFPP
jgi:hypothetical protein